MNCISGIYGDDEPFECNCSILPYFSSKPTIKEISSPSSQRGSRVSQGFLSRSSSKISLTNGKSRTLTRKTTGTT